MDYHALRYAIGMLKRAAREREKPLRELHEQAAARARAGRLDEAEADYTNLLAQCGDKADWWYELAMLHGTQGKIEAAVEALLKSLALDSSSAKRHYELGTLLEQLGDSDSVAREYLEELPLGHLRMVEHRVADAVDVYASAHELHPEDFALATTLASALDVLGEQGKAALLMGHAHYRVGRRDKVIEELSKAIALGSVDAAAYAELAASLNATWRYAEAIQICRTGLERYPREGDIYRELAWALGESNRTNEAIATAEWAAEALASPQFMAATRYLSLPVVYENAEQIGEWRGRFTDGLRRLVAETNLEDPSNLALARKDIAPQFYLGYQGLNDMPLQREYGKLVARVMSAVYHGWAEASALSPAAAERRIRIGYIFAENKTGINPLFLAWMSPHDPQRFEVVCFQVGEMENPDPHEVKTAAAEFHHLPEELERICQCVVDSRLDLLVYLYIGMGSLWTQMAALRLAPIQCATWGHPMTTGLPTIDYFISNELMEPEDADAHYSESLVRLPGIGVCPVPTFLPPLARTRADFGLPEDVVLYVSPQAAAKYLPQYDKVFVAIAARVDKSLIVLIEPRAPEIGTTLRRRLEHAFGREGLEYEKFIRFLPTQNYEAYLDLMRGCDIFLDTFGWSGGMTTLDAVRCGLPVVTCPGAMMRGRQSAGILKQLEVTETIATSVDEYVGIAVRLGLDGGWRQQIADRLRERQDRVFDDQSCMQHLEDFYHRVFCERNGADQSVSCGRH